MSDNKPRLRKYEIDTVLANGMNVLNTLYNRARSHIAHDLTTDQLVVALTPQGDAAMVRRSLEVFGYVPDALYINYPTLRVGDFPGLPEGMKMTLDFDKHLSFMPPGYLAKVTSVAELPSEFVPTFAPVVEETVILKQMQIAATKAWQQVGSLSKYNLARMRRMWPAIDTIGKQLNVDLSLLPKPQGCPAADPELRELIAVGTTFVNAVMLMPPYQKNSRGYDVDLAA